MLDTYFKSYFSSFVLASLLGGAWLSAKVTNVFVARAVQPPVTTMLQEVRPTRAAATRGDDRPLELSDAFLARNLFDAEREDLTPPEPGGAEGEDGIGPDGEPGAEGYDGPLGDCDLDRCAASSIPANLLATLWSPTPGASRAVFQVTAGGEVVVLSERGMLLDQAAVTAIFRNSVCVNRAGTCELFSLDQAKKGVTSAPVAVAAPSEPAESELGQGVKKLDDKSYEIEKQEIDNVLSNLNQIAKQARIVPSFQDGKSNGFKLFSIRPNSLYSKIGIQNGDIVQKINGYEINSPDKALEIYSKLKDAESISVDLVRRGKPQTMKYSIR